MNLELLQAQINKIDINPISHKSDKQLNYYEQLSESYKKRFKGDQPAALVKYNNVDLRLTKLSKQEVNEILQLYQKGVYGKKRLAKQFGVSSTMIYKIITGKNWCIKDKKYVL
jgi:hypothetical protein